MASLRVVGVPGVALNVREFGAVGDGATDDAAAFQAALDEAVAVGGDTAAAGVSVFVPAGDYNIGSTVVFPAGAVLRGAGARTTVIRRTANIVLFDISGTGDSDGGMLKNGLVADLELNSTTRGLGTFTNPLVRLYYAQFVHWQNVNFRRAGCSAIKAVRYYDAQFLNCRWDYCGAAGHPAVHLMCSEQGKTSGQFGHSEDSCNNVYFMNCTWEQNPGTEIYFDGRQSDGSFNSSRRMNMCRIVGGKMENAISTERSNDARLVLANTSHFGVYDLLISAKGVADGASATDLLTLENCFNTVISRYTAVCTEASPAQQAVRSGISFKGGNVGVRVGQVAGSTVGSNNRPSVALVEFAGTNELSIDRAYYDNNPGGAALYSGRPTTWTGAQPPEGPQGVLLGSSAPALTPSTRALSSANAAYLTRYVPRRPLRVTQIKLIVTTVDATNPNVDVGVYSGAGARVASSGVVAGKLNATGIQTVDLTAPVQLAPGTVYYLAVSSASATGVVYGLGTGSGSTLPHTVAGGSMPNAEFGLVATSHPLPATLTTAINTGIGSCPALWLVDA